MTAHLGAIILELLEQAGERHLCDAEPDAYTAFLHQVGGANTLRRYDASATYWARIQLILDNFFSSAERVEVTTRLIEFPSFAVAPSSGASSRMRWPSAGCRT